MGLLLAGKTGDSAFICGDLFELSGLNLDLNKN